MVTAFANATTIVMPEDEQLIGKSPVIVEGMVLSTAAVERDGRIYTETVVSVSRTLKGSVSETITIRELGGVAEGRFTKIFGTPEFASGERVLLFLEQHPQGGYRTMDLFVGKFESAATRDGKRIWLRDAEVPNVMLLDAELQPVEHAKNVQRDAVKFEAFVAERVAGRAGVKNYGIENPVLAPGNGGRKIESNFELISEPSVYRWASFDNGTTANWYSGGTQTGYTGGGVSELQTAMGSWTSYTQANILYAYAGVRSGSFGGLGARNGANEVLFDDPLNEITGTFNRTTGGVVGTGGFNGVTSGGNWTSPFAADAAHPQGTMRAFSIIEGNLVIQDGVTPSAGVSSNRLAEIVAHEFGHTLGFGHSADSTALMYASVTGLGPSLRTDDKLAARWLYPNGDVTPPPPPPTTVPTAPTSLTATPATTTAALQWNDNSTDEGGFSVYVAVGTAGFTKIGDVGANVTRATLSGLSNGSYRVYVLAFNAAGNSAQSNTVSFSVGAAVTAAFSFTPQTGKAGVTTFTFYDESTNATSRSWNFGDGTSSTNVVANKVYSRAGTFTVTLTATGAGGATSSVSQNIVVTAPLTAAFSFLPVSPTTNDTVAFTDESAGGVTSWNWTFGDGGSSSQPSPSKRYLNAGDYNVTLTVYRGSESASVTKTVTVRNAAPTGPTVTAAFDYSPAAPIIGQSVTFTDRSTGSPTSWQWSFGDGRTSSQRNPSITFNAPGQYHVTLTAGNAAGSAAAAQTVTVVAAAPHRSLISVTTQTNGVGGTAWRTELSLFNAGGEGASVTLLFIPGAGGSVITRSVFLAPKQSVTYANTLLDLFGVPNGAGAVSVEATSAASTPQLRVSSRTYTDGSRGTYGQAVPDVVFLDRTLFLTGLQSNDSFRTNLGLVNRSSSDTTAMLTLYDASGAVIGTDNVGIPANNFQQLPLSTYFPVLGGGDFDVLSMRISAASDDAISAYASVIDNRTQDPIYIQATPAPASGSLIFPVVGRSPGVNGTFWRSDVALFNPSSSNLSVSVRYGTATKTISLGSRDTVILDDVLSEFGLTSGQGTLTVTWSGGATGPVATSRTYTSTETSGTFGQSIDPVALFSSEVFVPGLRNDGSYRSNIGFVNAGSVAESFAVVLLSPSGTELAQTSVSLNPGQSTQFSIANLFPSLGATGSFTLAVRGDSDAKLFAYGSMVDNGSGDPVFFAGR
ncbi:MAG TPA: PKD domain-containing protein [Thermoanaerobaculia bacterium]|nr:PKD domain-containing protein [Thermoanaerobaculia bacterium]